MYQVIGGSENGNIGIKIEKKLTPDDYALLIPYIDRLRQKAGSLSLLCDMTQCEGLPNYALWGDLVDRLQQVYAIPRVAVVVAEPQEMESATMEPHPLHKTTVKYFTLTQLDKAWNWVEGDEI